MFAPRQLVWVDRSGRLLKAVGPLKPGLISQDISPDGRRAVATAGMSYSENALWIFDLAGDDPIRFSRTQNPERSGSWWPDGQSIVCVRDTGGVEKTLRLSVDGSAPEQELFDGPGLLSQSGRYLLVSQRAAKGKMTRGSVSLADPARKLMPLPDVLQRARVYRAELSPDDRHLAFESMESGQFEVYLTDFPRFTNPVPVSRGGGFDPVWHPNGTELFYLTGSPRQTLVSRKLRPDGRLEEPVDIFTLPTSIETGKAFWPRTYAVAPEGDRFLMLRKAEENAAPAISAKPNVRIVMNWFEELKESQ